MEVARHVVRVTPGVREEEDLETWQTLRREEVVGGVRVEGAVREGELDEVRKDEGVGRADLVDEGDLEEGERAKVCDARELKSALSSKGKGKSLTYIGG